MHRSCSVLWGFKVQLQHECFDVIAAQQACKVRWPSRALLAVLQAQWASGIQDTAALPAQQYLLNHVHAGRHTSLQATSCGPLTFEFGTW
jgi:hypothetical protein